MCFVSLLQRLDFFTNYWLLNFFSVSLLKKLSSVHTHTHCHLKKAIRVHGPVAMPYD